jgi:hypothetical protein
MTATLLLPTSGSSNNLDLFLRRADDVLLSASQTTFRQDLVYADNLATGAYKVIVASASGTSSYDLDISNATGAVRCGGTSFIAADAGPSPAAARSGYTDGPVSVAFPVTVFPNPSAWMVTVDDATPSNPAPPATDDPRWKAMSDLSLDLAAAVAAAPGGDGSHVLYPWLKDASGNVSPASDAAAASAGLVLDRSSPVVSVTAPVGGPFSSRSTIRPEWSTPATPTSALATLSYVVGSVVTTVASGAPATGSWTWKVPDTAATGARFRVAVTSPGGHVGSADSAPFDELGLGGFWVDGRGAIHPYGGAPSIDESPRWSFTIARGLSLASGGASGYLLDGWGGIHPFASNGSSPPPALAGGPYFPGFDIARALALRPAGGAYLLDGWGGIHAVGGAPAVSGGPYWRGWDIARDLVLLPGSSASGYVLDGWGGLHPFGGAPAATSGPYWRGWDIARRLVLGQDGQTGYVLDGFGGIHPLTFSGATHSPKAATSGPYWNGWDIARGFTLLPDESGGYLLDGYGGIHAFGLAGGAVPALSSSGYVAADVARGVAAR